MSVHNTCRILVPFVALTLAACTIKESSSEDDGGRPEKGSGGAADEESGGKPGSGGASGSTGGADDVDASTGSGGRPGAGGMTAKGGTTGMGGTPGSFSDGGAPNEAGVPFIDNCGETEVPANNDRDHSTPFTLGSTIHACLQAYQDLDVYSFTTPSSPVPGGVVVAKFTDVGTSGDLEASFGSVVDNGSFGGGHGDRGTNVTVWFAAKAGQKFRLGVGPYVVANQTKYTLEMTYLPVDDEYEPNDTRQTAAVIKADTAVEGHFFAAFDTSNTFIGPDDWYKLTLPAGMANVTLTHVAVNVTGNVELYSSAGVYIARAKSAAAGEDVTLQSTVEAADYYVHVFPNDDRITVYGGGSILPASVTTAYTLKATVK